MLIISTGGWPKLQRIDRLFIFGLLHLGVLPVFPVFAISVTKEIVEKRAHLEHENDPYEQIGDTLDTTTVL